MSGPLWLRPTDRGRDALPRVPGRAPHPPAPRPGGDPLDALVLRMDDVIAGAVHPDEIAAVLESDGMTDAHIRTAYGRQDSFALARDLYERGDADLTELLEPAAPGTPGGPEDPWRRSLRACLLRGVLFALPGLAYVAYGTPALLAGALAGWAWNQALAHRAYTWLGLGDRAAAARTLLYGAPVGAAVGAAVAAAMPGGGAWQAALQACYLAASTVLLVLGRERVLLVALLPVVAQALAPGAARPWLLAAALAGVAVAAAVAVATVLRDGPGQPRRTRPRVRPRAYGSGERRPGPRWLASLPYGLFGLGTGTLVLVVALDSAPCVVVALTLSMGPAEWLLHRCRSQSTAGLREARAPHQFRRAALLALARQLGLYLAVLLDIGAVAALLWPGTTPFGPDRIAALLLIGAVLWTALLLQSFGAVCCAAGVSCAAAAAQLLTPLPDLAVSAAAALVLLAAAAVVASRATAHRP